MIRHIYTGSGNITPSSSSKLTVSGWTTGQFVLIALSWAPAGGRTVVADSWLSVVDQANPPNFSLLAGISTASSVDIWTSTAGLNTDYVWTAWACDAGDSFIEFAIRAMTYIGSSMTIGGGTLGGPGNPISYGGTVAVSTNSSFPVVTPSISGYGYAPDASYSKSVTGHPPGESPDLYSYVGVADEATILPTGSTVGTMTVGTTNDGYSTQVLYGFQGYISSPPLPPATAQPLWYLDTTPFGV